MRKLKSPGPWVRMLFLPLLLAPGASAQGPPPDVPPGHPQGLRFITSVGDRVVFFFEDGLDPDTGGPMPPPSVPLAPITELKTIDFETGSVVVPGGSVRDLLQIDVYLRQRSFYRNDGQDRFTVSSNPFIQIESPVLDGLIDLFTGQPLDGVFRFAVFGNGLHLAIAKSLGPGESGLDSRGNFGRAILTREGLDARFGSGIGRRLFADDLTIRMSVDNRVQGLDHFVAGTFTQVYGE